VLPYQIQYPCQQSEYGFKPAVLYNRGMTKISRSSLEKHLQAVACLRNPFENPENLKAVEKYIQKNLEGSGYKITADPFRFEGGEFSSWIASREGAAEIPELIVGAHFDAVPGSPGADDNASGVAALLEIARAAAESHCPRNIHFVAFHLEEYGMAGSQAYVHKRKEVLKRAQKNGTFQGMLSLEMIGYTSKEKGSQNMPALLRPFYPNTGDFLALVGDSGSGALLTAARTAFSQNGLPVETLNVPLRGNLFPEVRLSDHSPFWDAGLPALLVTDTSFFRNPHYHLKNDTPGTLDTEFLTKVAEGVLNFLLKH
jgi:aminopeptidase YwaD